MTIDLSGGLDRFQRLVTEHPGRVASPLDLFWGQYEALREDLAAAAKKGIFTTLLPESASRSEEPSRIRVIRNRLARLGYLARDSGLPFPDPDLRRGVRLFQGDCDLRATGRVDERTWNALEELVSFEAPCHIPVWFRGDRALPALEKALVLRLETLGLTGSRDAAGRDLPAEGLENFCTLARHLRLTDSPPRSALCPETVERIFAQEDLVCRMAGVTMPPAGGHAPLAFSFAAALARVELWLAGYEVKPVRGGNHGLSGPAEVTERDGRSRTVSLPGLDDFTDLYQGLYSYWRDHGRTAAESRRLARDFFHEFPAFFRMIAGSISLARQADERLEQRIVMTAATENLARLPLVWQKGLTGRSRMWDGRRRVFGWLLHLRSHVPGRKIAMGRNMTRLLFGESQAAQEALGSILQRFPCLLATMLSRDGRGNDHRHILFRTDRQGDITVFVNPHGDRRQIHEILRERRRLSRLFRLSCLIIAHFMATLVSLIKSGRTGWIGLILALLQLAGSLKSLSPLLERYQKLT